MNRKERLGLAYVNMNNWKWDDFVGEKPSGFDVMPSWSNDNDDDTNSGVKMYYLSPQMQKIIEEIGEAACSRYWWKFALNKCYIQWFLWYYPQRVFRKLKRRASFLY